MKKIIKPMTVIIAAITMTIPTYGMTSQYFSLTDYIADGKILSTNNKVSSITLSDNAVSICATENCIYIEYHNTGNNYSYIYRCSNDLKEQTPVAAISSFAYSLCYYDNSIYYINPVEGDYSINEICSLNIETKDITKHITYNGDIELYGISNGYIYFSTETSYPINTRIFKQNVNNPQDKKLIYYSSQNYIYDYAIGENKLYISNFKGIDVIDLRTGKIINSYEGDYEIIGEYKGRLYLFNDGTIYKTLENNLTDIVSEKTEYPFVNLHPLSITNGKVQFTTYNYTTYTGYRYEYDIDNNEWTLLTSYTY